MTEEQEAGIVSVAGEETIIADELQAELDSLQLPLVRVTCPICTGQKRLRINGASGTVDAECWKCKGAGNVIAPVPTTMAEAVRVAKKLRSIEAQRKDHVGALDAEINALVALRDRINREAQQKASFWDHTMIAFHRNLLEASPKAKTVEVIPGVLLQARKAPDGLHYDDEGALIAHLVAAERDDAVRTKVELNRSAINKAAKVLDDGSVILPNPETGEVTTLPGVRRKVGETTFKVLVDVP